MRNLLVLCGAVFCFALTATAQDHSRVMADYSAARLAPSPQERASSEFPPWQVGIAYDYVRFDFLGSRVNLHGFNTSLTWYAKDWLGFEGDVAPAFGSPNVKLLWYGGGVHVTFRRGAKFEPWAHGLFGAAHLFPQTFSSRNALAYTAGGGVDIRLNQQVSWRLQGDFVGTHFFDQWQKNPQFVTGFVIKF